ncbi:cytochrome ubiquinol oxidase subunit II [Aliiroseovarius sp. 2305UL8-7]|uniref:cytochrome ubiquinol oxidase subunit II n=1 Tax=Aliiroseovarius conchicola TaxID=3121637 RepID=UPI003528FCFD
MKRIGLSALPVVGAGIVLSLVLPSILLAESSSFLDPGGEIAADQRTHLIRVTALTMVAIIPVYLLLPIILRKYRRGNKNADYKPRWEFSLPLEIAMWGVPAILVAIMSFYLWHSTHDLDPYKPIESSNSTVNVQVVGLDWKWLFIYPDLGIATVGEMGMPVDHPVAMDLTSDTVMQSFIVAPLAGQINTMAGMTTKLHMMADKPGTYEGENVLYSGNGFVDQKFDAIAMAPDAFDTWVAKVKSEGILLDQKAYDILAIQGSTEQAHEALKATMADKGTVYFNLPDAHLFHKIVMKYHDGKSLPLDQQPGTAEFNAAANQEATQ